ncbi:histidine phosphatase family protein [Geodermatophilus sp. TF02-6]|uniref:histidine phosphatase family protein n=1 Tax=Geodermatophilus sp. TF02-6 TaxID=2250575 RepID=UPI000DE97FF1|nr:histidine phosphatase family protein [Geodermatophilus sp. TF02-6]RBY74540.1 histidine phosphatase family protein [Geodermatophilus sp. TF02-6]
MDLHLIRHGESVPNVEPVIGGMRGDAGLTDRGREQARLLEQRLRAEGWQVDQLYSSTLPRARETAQYVSRALELPVQFEDDLQELRPGAADGLTVAEWRTRYGGFDGPMADDDPFRAFSPGGESWAGFLVRAGGALARIATRHAGETVVAVCHGGVIEASFYLAFGIGGTGNRVAFAPFNTGITHWRYEHGGSGRRRWTLVTFNDAGHLTGTTQPAEPPHEAVPLPSDDT